MQTDGGAGHGTFRRRRCGERDLGADGTFDGTFDEASDGACDGTFDGTFSIEPSINTFDDGLIINMFDDGLIINIFDDGFRWKTRDRKKPE